MDTWAQRDRHESGGLHTVTVKHLWEILSDKGTTKEKSEIPVIVRATSNSKYCSGGGLKWLRSRQASVVSIITLSAVGKTEF